MGAFGQDQAVNIVRQQGDQAIFFFLRLIAVVRQHRLITGGIRHGFDTADHFRKHLVGQRRQQHADSPAGGIG